jgi:hypothetical protein
MPSAETVAAFINQVVSGDHVGAIRDWYAPDAWMQENQGRRRQGRDVLMTHEARALERVARVDTELLEAPLVFGDRVAIRWRFTFVPKDRGDASSLEELAWQLWSDDMVVEETFFYDPGQIGR